ncbi:HRDC domain-containing protein [Eisenbergiella porci]
MPATGNELLHIPGFGEKKVTQYGPAILSILERYRKQ